MSSFISSFKRSREHTATRRCSSSSSLKQRQKLFEHQSVVLRLFLMTMMRVVVVVSRYKTLLFLALVSFLLCFPIGFVQSLSSDAEASGDHYRFGLGKRRDPFVFAPTRGQGRGIQMYYGSFGGASNCETCLVKARWLAEVLEVETLHVPACKRKPGDERAYPTMNPLEYFERESLRSCRRKDLGKESMMDGDDDDDDDAQRSFEGRSRRPTFEIESLERRITADEVNGMPCFEVVEGWCEIEKHRLGEYLIPKHKYKVEWKVTTSSLEKAREHAGEGKAIYFAGVYDFEPVDPETGKKYPNVWQKEAQRYVKGETQRLGWADEAVERRRKERDAVRAKKAAEAKENTNSNDHRHNNNNNNNKSDDDISVKQQSVPRKDMFLAQEQRIRQEQVNQQQQQQEEQHQISETTIREAWKENANRRRRRSRNLLAFSSIEPCLSNGNLNDEIYMEANKEIAKLQIEPSDTLCVHWRQEDFVWKKIGNEFVKNISYAAERIIHRAEAMKLNTVLLLTNDPEVYPEEKRHEGRVAVNTLRGMLHEIGGLRVEWSMHRNLPDRSKAIYIDKATCSMMVDFIGTGKSSFTATIMDMRQTHELCSINDPNAQLGKESNSNTKNGKELGTITDEEGDEEDLPPIKYKMCLKEKYGGSAKGDSSHDRSPFIFPVHELEHPIQAIETLLDIDATTPSNDNDNEQEEEEEEDEKKNNKLVLKGGPEVVDEYLTEENIHNFKLKEKAIEPGVEKLDHDEYVQEYEEENQKANAMKEFSVLDPSISAEDLKLDLRELDDDASVECDRCYAAMPQSEVAEPNAEIWLTTPSCEKCGIQLLKARRKRLNLGNHEY